jgi:transcriptional regulator CtsR
MEIAETKLKEILGEQKAEFQHVVRIFKANLESKINLIAEQYPEIKSTQKTQTEMIGSLMEDSQIIKSDVQFLKAELKKKVDYDEFDALTKRVALLESKIKK